MTQQRTGGQILIEGLIKRGVDTVFCVPGESYLGALDALYDQKDQIKTITCRQEGGAAYMAEAHGKLTGRPGVCFVSRGPGASNAMIGVHTAFQDSTPMLLFIGQVARSDTEREAFQELDYGKVYSDVAKKTMRFDRAHRIPEQLQKAWNIACSGRPGPVVIELPEDMLVEHAEVNDLDTAISHPAAPDSFAVEQVCSWIATAKKPIILCGGAGWTHRAGEHLEQLSTTQHIPVVTAFRRSDTFDNTHPHYAGELGLAPNPELVNALHQSDLMIVVGPRLGDITTSGYTLFDLPNGFSNQPDQRLVHVHLSDDEINSIYRSDLGITSHPERFLAALLEKVKTISETQRDQRIEFIRQLHQSYLGFLNAPRFVDAQLRMDNVAGVLRKRLTADTIITNGAGNYTTWAQRHYQFRQFGTQLASTNGSMGYGVPAAVAAKLLHPNRMVVSFSGDGCFLMNGQELATAVQYELNILFLVINNNALGTIQMHQQRAYPDRVVATELKNPDFAALAEAYGARGFTLSKTEEFESVFEKAIGCAKPALIELQTDYY